MVRLLEDKKKGWEAKKFGMSLITSHQLQCLHTRSPADLRTSSSPSPSNSRCGLEDNRVYNALF